jgi:hypothetical protein
MSPSEEGLPPAELCTCESMGGRFGGHRDECPWQVAYQAQAAAEMADAVESGYESYRDRRERNYLAEQARRAGLLEGKGGEGPETEVLESGEAWNTTLHEVVVRFRWSEVSRFTEGAMESIEMVDQDPIGTAIDAYLEPHFDTDSFEVLSKSHTVEHEDEEEDGEGP